MPDPTTRPYVFFVCHDGEPDDCAYGPYVGAEAADTAARAHLRGLHSNLQDQEDPGVMNENDLTIEFQDDDQSVEILVVPLFTPEVR